jgi:beta-lactamase class A
VQHASRPLTRSTRREAIASVAAAVLVSPASLIGAPSRSLTAKLADIQTRSKGRLGVAILDTASGRTTGLRIDERFPMCSTFKLLAVALVLHRLDHGEETFDRRVPLSASDLLPYAPTAEKRVSAGYMTVADLCEAAVTVSDNAAANLLLASFGGPAALTAFLRSIGDPSTRLDRNEPSLNESTPGDPRDTTTPGVIVQTLNLILLGNVLTPASRTRLCDWMIACTTGLAKLRVGFPAGTTIGDKTGSGSHGSNNDIAVIWRPGRKPLLIASYLTESPLSTDEENAIHAEVGRVIALHA